MKKLSCIIVILFSVFIGHAAEKPYISFFVGKVFIKENINKGGMRAEIGMVLGKKSIVKTLGKSLVEIRFGKKRVTIGEKSTVAVKKILAGYEGASDKLGAIRRLFDKSLKINRIPGVIGVRGKDDEDEVIWHFDENKSSGNEDNLILNDLITEFKQGKYREVISHYRKNSAKIRNSRRRADYLLSLSYLNLGRYTESARNFEILAIDKKDFITEDSLFYAGLSHHCMLNFRESTIWLSKYIDRFNGRKHAAYAFFLRGMNYTQLDKKTEAQRDLKTVIYIYSSSPLADDARKEYKHLK